MINKSNHAHIPYVLLLVEIRNDFTSNSSITHGTRSGVNPKTTRFFMCNQWTQNPKPAWLLLCNQLTQCFLGSMWKSTKRGDHLFLLIQHKRPNPNLMWCICRESTWSFSKPGDKHRIFRLCMMVVETCLQYIIWHGHQEIAQSSWSDNNPGVQKAILL